MDPEQYRVFLPGTRFFDAAANREAFDAQKEHSLVRVAPTIAAFLQSNKLIERQPDQAVAIMAKVVGMDPEQYRVFLPGTRFFDAAANREAFDAQKEHSLVRVAPTIAAFLQSNRLIEGRPDAERGVDPSLLDAALTP
ncbi:MAG: hypothetical protein JO042_02755 [Sinobacteraceae bacterium]|nr:hypothetical protein [Nevskiaceae bacterium]